MRKTLSYLSLGTAICDIHYVQVNKLLLVFLLLICLLSGQFAGPLVKA